MDAQTTDPGASIDENTRQMHVNVDAWQGAQKSSTVCSQRSLVLAAAYNPTESHILLDHYPSCSETCHASITAHQACDTVLWTLARW
jgi:hypothetical protein